VALEVKGADRTAYVRGLQLIRQTKVNGPTADDLFPLHGHLGTSMGAVDADGNWVEQVDANAFGNLDQPASLKQAHLYTGEYWDQDSQLLYLRARWYDPKMGRFISGDPFEGKQQDPRSLNRYSYSHGDPVHNTDASGQMTLGETMTTLNNVSMAYTAASIVFDVATGNYIAASTLRPMSARCSTEFNT
jgi:RHS repeat-associated protein